MQRVHLTTPFELGGKAINYVPPYHPSEEPPWYPDPPSEELCREYCSCNQKSTQAIYFKDHCDCLRKCLEKRSGR